MQLSEPKMITFLIAVALAVIGLIVELAKLGAFGFWLVVVAFVVLAVGNLVKGL